MQVIARARNIIVHPALEWPVIDIEPSSVRALYTNYVVPLGLIGPVASFIGLTIIGVSIPFVGTIRYPLVNGLTSAAIAFAALLVGIYVWALIINALAPTFSGQRNILAALKVAVYAATPAMLAGILSLLPALGILQLLAALYALYLLYLGLPVLMRAPKQKAVGYTAVSVGAGILVGIVLGLLMTAVRFSPLSGALGMQPRLNSTVSEAAGAAAAANIASNVIGAAGGTDESKKAAATIIAGAVAAGTAAEAVKAAPSSATDSAPTDVSNAGAAAQVATAALSSLAGGGKTKVEPVRFQMLKALLPAGVDALKRTDASGEQTVVAGIATSSSEGTYADGTGGRVNVKITDMGNVSGIMALGQLAVTTEAESDSGFERNVVLGAQKVHEKWTASGKQSELMAFVSDRFTVEVNGTGVDMPVAEKAFAATDVAKLADLKQ